jgi:2,5-furandicarboxylate decarboxylase 1
MPFQDFRAFFYALKKAGELIEVDRPVSPKLEVAKAMHKSAAVSGPAVIFKGQWNRIPVGYRTERLS